MGSTRLPAGPRAGAREGLELRAVCMAPRCLSQQLNLMMALAELEPACSGQRGRDFQKMGLD